jgi:hypothetical protein
MKNILLRVIAIVLLSPAITYAQDTYYTYSTTNKTIGDKPDFFNIDSIIKNKNFKVVNLKYSSVDYKIANEDMEMLAELRARSKSFTKSIDYTFIMDLGIVFNEGMDTVKLKSREFVYTDSIEATTVFNYLNKKIVSAIIVPNYRIIYRQGNKIYFISIKEYDKKLRKKLPIIMNPIYDALSAKNDNLYLLFHHDLRIQTTERKK